MKPQLFLLLISISFELHAQIPQFLSKKIDQPKEVVAMSGLKPYYLAGEKIDIATTVKDLTSQSPSQLSIPLYLDFIDLSNGKLLKHLIIKLENGKADISFFIPLDLPTGNYQVRAYTNWMRNFSEEYFFKNNFTVFSQKYAKEIPTNIENPVFDDLLINVEGGKLVEGLKSKIAIQTKDNFGRSISQPIFLIANQKDTLINTSTDSIGISIIDFTPKPNETYQILAENKTFSLPKPLLKGTVMSIDNVSSTEKIRVFLTSNNTESDTLTFVLLQAGQILYWKSLLNKSSILFHVSKNELNGKIYCILLNQYDETIAERIIEISPKINIDSIIATDRQLLCHKSTNILYKNDAMSYRIEKGITLKGSIKKLNGGTNKKDIRLSMVISNMTGDTTKADRQTFFTECKDKFIFEDVDFYGKQKVVFIAPENKILLDTTVSVPTISVQKFPINWFLIQPLTQKDDLKRRNEVIFAEIMRQNNGSIILEEVQIKAKRIEKDSNGLTTDTVVGEKIINRYARTSSLVYFLGLSSCAGLKNVKFFVNNLQFDDFDALFPDSIERILVFRNVQATTYKCDCALVAIIKPGLGTLKINESYVVQGFHK